MFKNIETFAPNQIQKSQIRTVHKFSGLRCSLHFNAEELKESAEIILQLTKLNPMSKSIYSILLVLLKLQIFFPILVELIIKRIRAWQESINNISRNTLKELPYFEFNTYTIAILVIFSLQMNSLLPPMHLFSTLLEDNSLKYRTEIKTHQLSSCLFAFFDLYGNEFKMDKNVISVKSGQWLEYQLEADNPLVSPLQKR